MSETIVVEVGEDVGHRLRQRAKQNGQTVQQLTQTLLTEAVKTNLAAADVPESSLGGRLAHRFTGLGFEEADFPEWKGHKARNFDTPK